MMLPEEGGLYHFFITSITSSLKRMSFVAFSTFNSSVILWLIVQWIFLVVKFSLLYCRWVLTRNCWQIAARLQSSWRRMPLNSIRRIMQVSSRGTRMRTTQTRTTVYAVEGATRIMCSGKAPLPERFILFLLPLKADKWVSEWASEQVSK